MLNYKEHPEILQFESFLRFNHITHFSTTRSGGCSLNTFESFNLSEYSGDQEEHVVENREKLCNILQLNSQKLFVPFQSHGTGIFVIEDHFMDLSEAERKIELQNKDALITARKDVCIGVTTADCVPVLLYAEDKNVIGAVHAGWRGTQQFILQKTVQKMIHDFGCHPSNIHAAIGPSICCEAFEVGDEVYESFQEAGFEMQSISHKNPPTGKYHIDLQEANCQQLINSGVLRQQIEISGICTHTNSDRFFSARKLGIKSGRMLTGICLLSEK